MGDYHAYWELIDPSINAKKCYFLGLVEERGVWKVRYAYGRIGNTLQERVNDYTSYAAARNAFSIKVTQRNKKGYRRVAPSREVKKPSWWTGRFLKKPVPIKHWVDFKDPTRTACGFLQNDTHPIADRKSEVDCPECIKALKGNVPVRPPVVEEPEPKRKVMRRPNADWNF